jgi:3-deoxy-D-manno-octulosonic acid kinase
MTNGGQRIATASGVMLADPAGLGNALQSDAEALFDPDFWAARGELDAVDGGRGAAWFIGPATNQWVLRHYRRGGLIAGISQDRYVWTGERRVRAFEEWRLLEQLAKTGLPVPKPIAAWYRRAGLTYSCDLIIQRIADARSLSSVLRSAALSQASWHAIGAMIARFHHAGVDHADLNAHNILLDAAQRVSVIDFDRGRLRTPGNWRLRNLRRLHRSLLKISGALPPERITAQAWDALMAGYLAFP